MKLDEVSLEAYKPHFNADFVAGETSLCIDGSMKIEAGDTSIAALANFIRRLDGLTSVADVVRDQPGLSRDAASALLTALDSGGFLDTQTPTRYRSGHEVILEIEELTEQCCRETIFQNPFWKTCLAAKLPGDLPWNLAVGMAIENWHFLHRESYFDAPVLSYVSNTAIRLLLNQFFAEEYGHDEILLESLVYAGFTREDMMDAIPLPETMGLCNALAYWAHNDPLFFFATLGLLEGQGLEHDSFISACERTALPEKFVEPLRRHANINLGAAHGSLTRLIFQQIPAIDATTERRLKAQIPLFVRVYDEFYGGVYRAYSSDKLVLRRVSRL